MLITASCRAHLMGNLFNGDVRWRLPAGFDPASIEGKRVCVFVHGLKVSEEGAIRAYTEILNRAPSVYDIGIGFLWPAGATPLAYPYASIIPQIPSIKSLRQVLRTVAGYEPARLDLNGHSLGAGLVLGAIRKQPSLLKVDNVYLLAACMLPILGEYRNDVRRHVRGRVEVLYSHRDLALASSWFWPGTPGPKLGQIGEVCHTGTRVARSHDYTDEVGINHNAYRRSSRFYQLLVDSERERSKERSCDGNE